MHCGVLVLFVMAVSQIAQADDRETIAALRAAWDSRHKQVWSFRYDCQLKEDFVISKVPSGNPFDVGPGLDDSAPRTVEELRRKITFAKSGRKLAYVETGNRWDRGTLKRTVQDYKVAFNGVYNRQFSPSGIPSGEIDRSHQANDSLTAGADQVALWMWHSPVDYLMRQGYELNSISVRNSQVDYAGTPCIELLLPRGESPWRGYLFLDPKRDYVPLRFVQERSGVTRSDLSIDYRRHDVAGHCVSSWREKEFDDKGRLLHTRTASVDEATINAAIDDALFAVSFPAGTRVVERTADGKKYYMQQDDGELTPISMEEFIGPVR